MDNSSQLVLRNRHRLSSPLLVIGAPDDTLCAELDTEDTILTEQFSHARRLSQKQGPVVVFGCDGQELDRQRYAQALVFMAKSREELKMRLALAASCLSAEGELLLVGGKREGIASGGKVLQQHWAHAHKFDSARHCQLWSARPQTAAATFSSQGWLASFEVDVEGQALTVFALPGVFSSGRLDPGTRLLLETFDAPPQAPVLDFACGAGIIAAWLGKRYGIKVDLVDTQAQAVLSSRETLKANDVTGRVWASDGLSEVDGRYGLIVTNPPFHSGVKLDTGITERFLTAAAAHLLPGGELRLVANAFLPYQPLIESLIGPCQVLAQDSRFKVYSAIRAQKKETL